MPRGSPIPPAVRREWLEAHETGKRLDAIAREASRSERTVQAHLLRARQERDQQEIRAGLLRDAYRQHFEDLMTVAEEVRSRALKSNKQGILIFSERRSRLLYEALALHLPGALLWAACKRWDGCARDYAILVEEGTSVIRELVSPYAASPELIQDDWVDSLWYAVVETAKGGSLQHMRYRASQVTDGWRLDWGGYGLDHAIRDEETCRLIQERHQRLVAMAVGKSWSALRSRLRSVLQRWERARSDIDEEVEMLLLQRLLPGACYLCPPGAVAAPARRRRRLKSEGGADEGPG